MVKRVAANKVRQYLGRIMNEVALKSDEYIVDRDGEPLVAIIPVERYLSMKRQKEEFFRRYEELQREIKRG